MRSDGTGSSPDDALEIPMDVASTGTPGEMPRVNTRGVGRGRGQSTQAISSGNAFPTMERPARAKKNYRPAQVVLDHSIQRRTSEQVKADKAKAKAEAAAAEAAAKAHRESQRDRVAALEDAKQLEEYTQSLQDLRPDLHIGLKSASNTDVEKLRDSPLTLDEPTDPPLPLEHDSYHSSSHSEDFLTGWLGGDAIAEEGQDQDFVMQSDNEFEASEASEASHDQTLPPPPSQPRPKAKFKPQYERGTFRATVNEARQVLPPPPSQLKKRKGPEPPPPVDGTSTKRYKTSEPGGLVYNWKENAGLLEHIANKYPVQFIDEQDDFVEGEFDREEQPDMLNAVRASKSSVVKINSVSSGTKITPRPIFKGPGSARPKAPKVMVDDLPFPHPRAAYNARWQKVFRPTLLAWASTYPDPYATNTQLEDTIVLEMWDMIYPDISLNEEERRDIGSKLVYLAANILNDWRTTIGTGALNVVKNHFLLPANQFHNERIAGFVKWGLDPNKFNFIYGAPNAEANQKQGFRSELILNVYAIHLKKTVGCAATYGNQIGALALCTAATERALTFWASGDDMSTKMDENGKRKLAAPFGEMEWGPKARGWSRATTRLTSEQWRLITAEATIRSKKLSQDEAQGEDTPEVDPRAMLEL